MKIFAMLFLASMCCVSASAQYDDEMDQVVSALPDTFHFFKAENVVTVRSLDSLGVAVDTLDEKIYIVLMDQHWSGKSYAVAWRTRDGYTSFFPASGEMHDSVASLQHIPWQTLRYAQLLWP